MVLQPLIEAEGDDARNIALQTLLTERVLPLVNRVVARLGDEVEIEDLVGVIMLRLIPRLRAATTEPEQAISSLDDYVATLSHHVVYDALRQRFPARTRLKQQLRWLLTHDERFALWQTRNRQLCGLRAWHGAQTGLETLALPPSAATAVESNPRDPAAAVLALLKRAGEPVALDALVNACASLWNVVDLHVDIETIEQEQRPPQLFHLEARESLRILWSEIVQLRPMQRTALLLNLRDTEGMNAVAFLVLLGIATTDEIARMTGLTLQRLHDLWDDLPLDDLTIAGMLGSSRQQVINLRKSARERLTRRLRMRTSINTDSNKDGSPAS